MSKERKPVVRIQLDLSPEMNDQLTAISRKHRSAKAAQVRRAIKLLSWYDELKTRGGELVIREGKEETEVLFI